MPHRQYQSIDTPRTNRRKASRKGSFFHMEFSNGWWNRDEQSRRVVLEDTTTTAPISVDAPRQRRSPPPCSPCGASDTSTSTSDFSDVSATSLSLLLQDDEDASCSMRCTCSDEYDPLETPVYEPAPRLLRIASVTSTTAIVSDLSYQYNPHTDSSSATGLPPLPFTEAEVHQRWLDFQPATTIARSDKKRDPTGSGTQQNSNGPAPSAVAPRLSQNSSNSFSSMTACSTTVAAATSVSTAASRVTTRPTNNTPGTIHTTLTAVGPRHTDRTTVPKQPQRQSPFSSKPSTNTTTTTTTTPPPPQPSRTTKELARQQRAAAMADALDEATRQAEARLWKQTHDPKSGREYWYHTKTRETQWHKPTCCASPQERAEAHVKEMQTRDFFSAMEANILSSMSSGTLYKESEVSQQSETVLENETTKDGSAAAKTKNGSVVRPNLVRTISAMEDSVLASLIQRVPSSSQLLLSKGSNHSTGSSTRSIANSVRRSSFDMGFAGGGNGSGGGGNHALVSIPERREGSSSEINGVDFNGWSSINSHNNTANNINSSFRFEFGPTSDSASSGMTLTESHHSNHTNGSGGSSGGSSTMQLQNRSRLASQESFNISELMQQSLANSSTQSMMSQQTQNQQQRERRNHAHEMQFRSLPSNLELRSSCSFNTASSNDETINDDDDNNDNKSCGPNDDDGAEGKPDRGLVRETGNLRLQLQPELSAADTTKDNGGTPRGLLREPGTLRLKPVASSSSQSHLTRENSMPVECVKPQGLGSRENSIQLGSLFQLDSTRSMNNGMNAGMIGFENSFLESTNFDLASPEEGQAFLELAAITQEMFDMDSSSHSISSSNDSLNGLQLLSEDGKTTNGYSRTLARAASDGSMELSDDDPVAGLSPSNHAAIEAAAASISSSAMSSVPLTTSRANKLPSTRPGIHRPQSMRTGGTNNNSSSKQQSGSNHPGRIQRRNTCGTIYVSSTMSAPDKDATIRCVCGVFRAHILQSQLEDRDDRDEGLRPEEDPFVAFHDLESQRRRSSGLSAVSDASVVTPTLEEITLFYRDVFGRARMESDCIIMSLIYVERLIKVTGGALRPRTTNWRSILFSCMVLSSKVWDDCSMWNADFGQTCPAGVKFPLARVNQLELCVLDALEYKVKVPASEYAKYYFLLRTMLIKSGLGSSQMSASNPLDVAGAKKLQHVSSRYQSTAATPTSTLALGRSKSTGSEAQSRAATQAQPITPTQGKVGLEHMVQM